MRRTVLRFTALVSSVVILTAAAASAAQVLSARSLACGGTGPQSGSIAVTDRAGILTLKFRGAGLVPGQAIICGHTCGMVFTAGREVPCGTSAPAGSSQPGSSCNAARASASSRSSPPRRPAGACRRPHPELRARTSRSGSHGRFATTEDSRPCAAPGIAGMDRAIRRRIIRGMRRRVEVPCRVT